MENVRARLPEFQGKRSGGAASWAPGTFRGGRSGNREIHRVAAVVADLEFFRELADSISGMLLVLDRNRQIVFANQVFLNSSGHGVLQRALGLRPGEALECVRADRCVGGCGTSQFCSTCGAARAIHRALAGNKDVQECSILRKNGDSLDLRVSARPFSVQGMELLLLEAVDITHEKRRRALEMVFFHDILNTAAALRGFSELLPNETDPGRRAAYENAFRHLSLDLIEEIHGQRDLAAAEANELLVNPQATTTRAVLERSLRRFSRSQENANSNIVLSPDIQEAALVTDSVILARVLSNMVKNALEASAPGRPVTVGSSRVMAGVRFWVHNEDPMPLEAQLQVFLRSYSTKGPGRGLGTHSMKLLGEQVLGGRVCFCTGPGFGTVFSLYLPLSLPE